MVPSPEEVEALIAPYVIGRWRFDDPFFQEKYRRLMKKWRRARRDRRLFGWRSKHHRTPSFTEQKYNRIWSAYPWPENAPAELEKPKLRLVRWGEEGFEIGRYAVPRVHLLLMARIIRALGARSVLEVGCGSGTALFTLAALLPEVRFSGVELSTSGVAQASMIAEQPQLPESYAAFCPGPVDDPEAHRRVQVRQGNAAELPFESDSFDLVYTHQALEQMQRIREVALREIARVAGRHVLLVEPFADANRDDLRRTYVKAKEYFSLSVAELPRFGIEPIFQTHAYPQKTTLGIETVVARV